MTKVLLVDNYDSFTFNIKHYLEALGAHVSYYLNDDPKLSSLDQLDFTHVVLSPGPGSPKDAGKTLQVIDHCYRDFPILGICLGHQCLASYFGGRIVHAKHVMHGVSSAICHNGKSIFAGLPSPFSVMRYHSLVVDQCLPSCLQLTAWVCGQEQTVMAIAHKDLPIVGLQYHPEAVLTEYGYQVLAQFLEI